MTIPNRTLVMATQELPFPGSPDQLMANFQTIYETRDFDEYRKIMHPDFLTILQEATTQEFPDVGNHPGRERRTADSRAHVLRRGGDRPQRGPGARCAQHLVQPLSKPWTPGPFRPPTTSFPTRNGHPYEVEFLFDRGQTFSTLKVDGTIKFYVTSRDSMYQGSLKKYYQMIGQEDETNLK